MQIEFSSVNTQLSPWDTLFFVKPVAINLLADTRSNLNKCIRIEPAITRLLMRHTSLANEVLQRKTHPYINCIH